MAALGASAKGAGDADPATPTTTGAPSLLAETVAFVNVSVGLTLPTPVVTVGVGRPVSASLTRIALTATFTRI